MKPARRSRKFTPARRNSAVADAAADAAVDAAADAAADEDEVADAGRIHQGHARVRLMYV